MWCTATRMRWFLLLQATDELSKGKFVRFACVCQIVFPVSIHSTFSGLGGPFCSRLARGFLPGWIEPLIKRGV
jgi:hypothetical protein